MIQVPQFLLEHIWSKGETCKIVCTQPRRISATSGARNSLRSFLVNFFYLFICSSLDSKLYTTDFCLVAERISVERGENIGDNIGYKVIFLKFCWCYGVSFHIC